MLVVAKNAPQLKESLPACLLRPVVAGGPTGRFSRRRQRSATYKTRVRRSDYDEVCGRADVQADRPVIDMIELTGKYDIRL